MGAHEVKKRKLEDTIKDAVTDEWQSSREIWTRIGAGAENTIANKLALMFESGDVERDRRPRLAATGRTNGSLGTFMWVYRKVQHAHQA